MPPTTSPSEPSAPSAPSAVRRLVGELLPEGVLVCKASGERTWQSPHHVIGFTPLLPADGLDLAPRELDLVVATGAVEPRGLRLPPVTFEAECPPAQMRSDWVEAKTGIRVERPGMGQVGPAFRVEAVARFEGLVLERRGEALHLELVNTLDEPLEEVTLTVHYEGCYGKPGSAAEHTRAARLEPGGRLAFDAPILVERGEARGRTTHRAFSVQVQARGASTAFDFDRRLARAGLPVECPER